MQKEEICKVYWRQSFSRGGNSFQTFRFFILRVLIDLNFSTYNLSVHRRQKPSDLTFSNVLNIRAEVFKEFKNIQFLLDLFNLQLGQFRMKKIHSDNKPFNRFPFSSPCPYSAQPPPHPFLGTSRVVSLRRSPLC